MLPREKEPLIMAAANARFVGPATLATVHCIFVSVGFLRIRTIATYVIEDSKRGDDSIDEVDTSKDAGRVAGRKE